MTGSVGGVIPPQPVLGGHVQHDGENEQRDDEVEANGDAEQRARRVRQRQPDALQKPEVVKRDFRLDTSVGATRRCQTFHVNTDKDKNSFNAGNTLIGLYFTTRIELDSSERRILSVL